MPVYRRVALRYPARCFGARSVDVFNHRVTVFGHNVRMSDRNILTLRQADQARTDVGHSHLLLTRGQRLKLRLFLGFARYCVGAD